MAGQGPAPAQAAVAQHSYTRPRRFPPRGPRTSPATEMAQAGQRLARQRPHPGKMGPATHAARRRQLPLPERPAPRDTASAGEPARPRSRLPRRGDARCAGARSPPLRPLTAAAPGGRRTLRPRGGLVPGLCSHRSARASKVQTSPASPASSTVRVALRASSPNSKTQKMKPSCTPRSPARGTAPSPPDPPAPALRRKKGGQGALASFIRALRGGNEAGPAPSPRAEGRVLGGRRAGPCLFVCWERAERRGVWLVAPARARRSCARGRWRDRGW